MADFEITERTEPLTLDEVFSFIDDTNISKRDAHELKKHNCGSDCPEHESRVITNADKIRNMDDTELAEILSELVLRALHFYCGTEAFENINFRRDVEIDMKLEWLQSEAE